MDIKTSIEINAPSNSVWQILTDVDKYPEWNPFITKISGRLYPGEKLKVRLHPPGKRERVVKPIILNLVQEKEIVWLGHILFPGIFDAEHHFIIESVSDSTVHFYHNQHFSGIFLPLFWKMLYNHVRIGFIEMNQALKRRAEGKYQY